MVMGCGFSPTAFLAFQSKSPYFGILDIIADLCHA